VQNHKLNCNVTVGRIICHCHFPERESDPESVPDPFDHLESHYQYHQNPQHQLQKQQQQQQQQQSPPQLELDASLSNLNDVFESVERDESSTFDSAGDDGDDAGASPKLIPISRPLPLDSTVSVTVTVSVTEAVPVPKLGNGNLLMNEQDADLLESIQLLNSDSIITTPLLTSTPAPYHNQTYYPSHSQYHDHDNTENDENDIPPLSLDFARPLPLELALALQNGRDVLDSCTDTAVTMAATTGTSSTPRHTTTIHPSATDNLSTSYLVSLLPTNTSTKTINTSSLEHSIPFLSTQTQLKPYQQQNATSDDSIQLQLPRTLPTNPEVQVRLPLSSSSSSSLVQSPMKLRRSRTGKPSSHLHLAMTREIGECISSTGSGAASVTNKQNDFQGASDTKTLPDTAPRNHLHHEIQSESDINSDVAIHTLKVPMRRALSGEVWTVFDEMMGSNKCSDTNITAKTLNTTNLPVNAVNKISVDVNGDVSKLGLVMRPKLITPSNSNIYIRRTDSTERRMNEVAQFVEAVGEENTSLQIIDDDDDRNAYDDDDDDEVDNSDNNNNNKITETSHSNRSQHTISHDSNVATLDNQQTEKEETCNDVPSSQLNTSKEREKTEVVLFASAVGEFGIALQDDPTNTIRIIDDDDDQSCDDDDEENNVPLQQTCTIDAKQSPPDKIQNQNQLQLAIDSPLLRTEQLACQKQPFLLELQKQEELESKIESQQSRNPELSSSLPKCVTTEIEDNQFRNQQNSFAISRRKNLSNGFLDKLPDDYNSAPATAKQLDFVYKGIKSNPPEIVKRGTARGNYAQLHRKAWLEVSDKYHRYGKNLRLYYRYWESLGFPTNMFFDWLDSKGEAAGQPLPELEECPRSKLDSDTVLYITNPQITQSYAIRFIPIITSSNNNLDDDTVLNDKTTPSTAAINTLAIDQEHHKYSSQLATNLKRGLVVDAKGQPVRTGPDGWIFVLRDNEMYGSPKVTSAGITNVLQHPVSLSQAPPSRQQRFHHSSFFGGKAVAAAGIFITDDEGILTRLYPHSGHYRPGEAHMQRVLFYLNNKEIDLRTFEMDIQQILHIARCETKDTKVQKKSSSCTSKKKADQDEKKDNYVTAGSEANNYDVECIKNTVETNLKMDDNKVIVGIVEKKKKIESLHLMPAIIVACFLAHKARFIGGIFAKIHKIRKRGKDITNVTEALNLIDDGGCFWSSYLGKSAMVSNNNNQKLKNSNTNNVSTPSEQHGHKVNAPCTFET
jgi:hypothetical protein